MPEPNASLAAVMDEADCSNNALAKDVRSLASVRTSAPVSCTHVDVGRWLAGAQPRGDKPALIAEALGRRLNRVVSLAEIGMNRPGGPPVNLALDFTASRPTLLTTARTLWTADLHRSTFLRGTVAVGALTTPMARWLLAPDAEPVDRSGRPVKVGLSDVNAIVTTTHMFADLDNRFGGGHARTAAVQYLTEAVSPLLHGSYTDTVGSKLFAAAAQTTYKVGAMAYDIGEHGLARRYFVQALSLAHAAGDRPLGGKVLALMSHQATYLREFQHALDFARAAKLGAAAHATPAVKAMYCAMEARALAGMGDARACARAMREAESWFDRADPDVEPGWIGYFDHAELHDEFGHCASALRHQADAAYHAGLALGTDDQFPRSRTFCRLSLAMAHLHGRDVEQACATATTALTLAGQIKSARVRRYLHDFNQQLNGFDAPRPINAFRERGRELLAVAA